MLSMRARITELAYCPVNSWIIAAESCWILPWFRSMNKQLIVQKRNVKPSMNSLKKYYINYQRRMWRLLWVIGMLYLWSLFTNVVRGVAPRLIAVLLFVQWRFVIFLCNQVLGSSIVRNIILCLALSSMDLLLVVFVNGAARPN
jgi:hypothetical protein